MLGSTKQYKIRLNKGVIFKVKTIKKYRNIVLRVFDIFIIAVAYLIAYLMINDITQISIKQHYEMILKTIVL